MKQPSLISQAVAFTEAYKQHRDSPAAVREAMCLKAQYPAILGDIQAGDLFAGRRRDDTIALFTSIWWAAFPAWLQGERIEGKQGGYIFDFSCVEKYGDTEEKRRTLTELCAFWKRECSAAKVGARQDEELIRYTGGSQQIMGSNIGFCLALDLDRLVRLGLPGLRQEVTAQRAAAVQQGRETSFADGALIVLDVVADVCRSYAAQARDLARESREPSVAGQLTKMADVLEALAVRPPRTFREATQLVWLYTVLACWKHPDAWRLDVALGDLYCRDLDAGVCTAEEAMAELLSLWRLFTENGEPALCRIVIGGIGRRNERNADRFALAAMEATRRHQRVTPQLTLRFHRGQDPALLQRAYATIGETGVYPMLYNDDVIVPGVAAAFGVPETTAQLYHPLGCGEYMLATVSPSFVDTVWSIPQSLDAALHNGKSSDGQVIGPETGPLADIATFDELYRAFLAQAAFTIGLAARTYKYICEGYRGDCAFLLGSLLTDDCVTRGQGLLNGGVRYLGACIMGHGFTTAADSLTAIRKVVFEDRRVSLAQLADAIDRDFDGCAEIRQLLLAAPKFGNDLDAADRMLAQMWDDINRLVREAGVRTGFDFLTLSNVNPGGYGCGKQCGATADGRRRGMPFAIGNAPTAGFDTHGLTALFNSLAKISAANGGATTNIKIAREFFTSSAEVTPALFATFFAKGGQQASITTVNRDDLAAALKEPAKYPHVLVRLGGWSARFIDLERSVQEEILRRTLY